MAKVKKQEFEKIYVNVSDVPLTKTRKALVKLFVMNKGYRSYKDEECTVLQCEKGRYRSLTELHQMVLTRFPLTSFSAILKIVMECIEENTGIIMVYCPTVKKVVLRYQGKQSEAKMITDFSRKNYFETVGEDGSCLKTYEEQMKKIKEEYNKI